jgi:uncharacterized membrane protein YebE (DUF533 family)
VFATYTPGFATGKQKRTQNVARTHAPNMKPHIGRTDYLFALGVAIIIIGVVAGSTAVTVVGIVVTLGVFAYAVYNVLTRKNSQLKSAAKQHQPHSRDSADTDAKD